MIKIYEETFRKADGTLRKMKFVRLRELSLDEISSLGIVLSNSDRVRNLKDGFETVWDVDKKEYRTFN